ncbi:hypothetical protein TNCV_3536831 [Trichonephila clavipes]|uniref:Uncharacterized protein n=1 Tax=Trichonephila clavipes TaxID=2585209 RepID=A0A8X6VWV3_TRICX|nr:hypothetical protein TNCV_3536831 [Trichonephila clavipes]
MTTEKRAKRERRDFKRHRFLYPTEVVALSKLARPEEVETCPDTGNYKYARPEASAIVSKRVFFFERLGGSGAGFRVIIQSDQAPPIGKFGEGDAQMSSSSLDQGSKTEGPLSIDLALL